MVFSLVFCFLLHIVSYPALLRDGSSIMLLFSIMIIIIINHYQWPSSFYHFTRSPILTHNQIQRPMLPFLQACFSSYPQSNRFCKLLCLNPTGELGIRGHYAKCSRQDSAINKRWSQMRNGEIVVSNWPEVAQWKPRGSVRLSLVLWVPGSQNWT